MIFLVCLSVVLRQSTGAHTETERMRVTCFPAFLYLV
jgi:hypothetical protein